MDFKLNDDQKRLVVLVDELGTNEFAPKAARWDENHEYPWENVHKLREAGILGMTIPQLAVIAALGVFLFCILIAGVALVTGIIQF